MLRIIASSLASTAVAVPAALTLAACSGSTSAADPSPSLAPSTAVTSAPISKQACNLKSDGDLIEWSRNRHPSNSDGSTGAPASAVEIGDVDLVNCKSYLDGWVANHSDNAADNAAGYRDCYEIAWAKDNPGYDVDASPAPRLKNVIEQAGNDC